MARPDPWVSSFKPGHSNPGVKAIIDYLSEWFEAIEDGTARERLPSPYYVRSRGRPPWTEKELERLVAAIDEEYQKEVDNYHNFAFAEATTGFLRLALPQRLALAQGLDALIAKDASDSLRTHQRDLNPSTSVSVNGYYASIYRNHYTGRYVIVGGDLPETEHDTVEEAKATAQAAFEARPAKSHQAPVYDECEGIAYG